MIANQNYANLIVTSSSLLNNSNNNNNVVTVPQQNSGMPRIKQQQQPSTEKESIQELKKSLTLDFSSPESGKKSFGTGGTPDLLSVLRFTSPDMEKIFTHNFAAAGGNTPTPTQFFYPKNVTAEQEQYARGFIDALNQLHMLRGGIQVASLLSPGFISSTIQQQQDSDRGGATTDEQNSTRIRDTNKTTASSMEQWFRSLAATAVWTPTISFPMSSSTVIGGANPTQVPNSNNATSSSGAAATCSSTNQNQQGTSQAQQQKQPQPQQSTVIFTPAIFPTSISLSISQPSSTNQNRDIVGTSNSSSTNQNAALTAASLAKTLDAAGLLANDILLKRITSMATGGGGGGSAVNMNYANNNSVNNAAPNVNSLFDARTIVISAPNSADDQKKEPPKFSVSASSNSGITVTGAGIKFPPAATAAAEYSGISAREIFSSAAETTIPPAPSNFITLSTSGGSPANILNCGYSASTPSNSNNNKRLTASAGPSGHHVTSPGRKKFKADSLLLTLESQKLAAAANLARNTGGTGSNLAKPLQISVNPANSYVNNLATGGCGMNQNPLSGTSSAHYSASSAADSPNLHNSSSAMSSSSASASASSSCSNSPVPPPTHFPLPPGGNSAAAALSAAAAIIDPTVQERLKLERKRARNRVAATRCRRRKLEAIAQLSEKVDEMKLRQKSIDDDLRERRAEVDKLKMLIEQHRQKGCKI